MFLLSLVSQSIMYACFSLSYGSDYSFLQPVTVLGSAESQIAAMDKILTFLDEMIITRTKREGEAVRNLYIDRQKSNGFVNPNTSVKSDLLRSPKTLQNLIGDDASLVRQLAMPDVISDSLSSGFVNNEQHLKSNSSPSQSSGINSKSSEADLISVDANSSSASNSTHDTSLLTSLINESSVKKKPYQSAGKTEFQPPLTVKILTHDHLIGRLIGRGGSNLAEIKQNTDTKITIPNSVPNHISNHVGCTERLTFLRAQFTFSQRNQKFFL